MMLELMQAHQGLLIFVLSLSAAHLLPLQRSYHPNTVVLLVFKGIAQRVYQSQAPSSYLALSGTLAFVLPVLTIVILCFLLAQFAYYPNWLGGLVLYLCLDTRINTRAKRIATLLKQGQKSTARQLLQGVVARDVSQLSKVGIAKACIDSTSLRTIRHYYVIIIFYLFLGPIAALSYKLLLLCDHAWRDCIKPNSRFLAPLKHTIYFTEWLPLRAFVLLMALFLNPKKVAHYIKHYARYFYQRNSGWILALFAANLRVQLGGPCFYLEQRFEKMRLGIERHPEPEDIDALLGLLKRIQAFFLLLVALSWLAYALSTAALAF
ncbi:cobalamin biosynthesis protein CobD/CbiB [Pseudoalteromonas byunsanensis]|uniref:Cobalamin biosynthesis protein n=1 Tax=Pseudoalteromonas byunsanensis TaxID=327939 RepID=A0A1S1N5Z9_9GAMM|nr:cobalamin biosynthesis protein [Pseudoalteromonas byunsanensis]OHU94069.1 cobalamin biosynthesis protein [Pseudoalteromonas byunsanensis]